MDDISKYDNMNLEIFVHDQMSQLSQVLSLMQLQVFVKREADILKNIWPTFFRQTTSQGKTLQGFFGRLKTLIQFFCNMYC